jgi:hypothetical protein
VWDLIVTYWGFVVTYIVPPALVILFIYALWKFLASRTTPVRPTVRSLDDKADEAGAAESKKDEQRIKAIFDDFRQKENLQ